MIRRAGDGSPLGKGRRGREHRCGERRGGVRVAGQKWQSGGVGATRAKFDQQDDGALGRQATGISETRVVSLRRTYSNDWSRYMVGPSCCVLGEFSSFQRINDSC
jgi:hypothetical protein